MIGVVRSPGYELWHGKGSREGWCGSLTLVPIRGEDEGADTGPVRGTLSQENAGVRAE